MKKNNKKIKEVNATPLKYGKVITAILSIITVIYISPIFVVLMNSFKGNTFVKTQTFSWPAGETFVGWANYIKGFTFGNYPFLKSVLYSFIITLLSTLLILFCTAIYSSAVMKISPKLISSPTCC